MIKTTKNAIIFILIILLVTVGVVSVVFVAERIYFYPLKFKEEVFSSSNEFGVDSALIFATAQVESNFNKEAVSSKGAIVIMQIKPSTAEFIAQKLGVSDYDLFDAKTNIRFGSWYLSYLITRFKNVDTAICAYNAGETIVRKWLNNKEYSIDKTTLFKIPYPETLAYLKKIKKSRKKYQKLCVHILDKSF